MHIRNDRSDQKQTLIDKIFSLPQILPLILTIPFRVVSLRDEGSYDENKLIITMNIKEFIKRIVRYDGSYIERKRSAQVMVKFRKEKGLLLRTVGIELLEELFAACEKCNVPIWLEYGTLLGAYREKSFIAHDFDLDTGIYARDYTIVLENELFSRGFKKQRMFKQVNVCTREELITEVTYSYKGFNVDIFFSFDSSADKRNVYVYVKKNEELTAKGIFNVNKYSLPKALPLSEVQIDDHVFNAPSDALKTLEAIYGKTFMIPDPTWVTTDKNYNVETLDIEVIQGRGVWGLPKE